MAVSTQTPPMRHSAAYYENRSDPRSFHPSYQHSPVVPLPLPPSPVARAYPDPRIPASVRRTDPRPAQSPVSSADSGSTADSLEGPEHKHYLRNKGYQYGPQAEQGYLQEPDARYSHYGSQMGTPVIRSPPDQSEAPTDNSAIFRYVGQGPIVGEEEAREDDHALWILMWMSFLDPFHCAFSAIYSIFALVVILILLPLRFCRGECSPAITLIRMVAPVFRNHLQMICARSLDQVHTFEFSPVCLLLVHIVSPILSLGNAVAAWIVAVFWLFAIIMGNPDGTERRDDGRATVLMLRDWWERCLLYATRK